MTVPSDMAPPGASDDTQSTSAARLRSFVERVERLEEDRRALAEDIKEVLAEAKGEGFDVKTLRQIIRLRKMDQNDRMEQEALLETYLSALGMR